jgi:hypothetical protein
MNKTSMEEDGPDYEYYEYDLSESLTSFDWTELGPSLVVYRYTWVISTVYAIHHTPPFPHEKFMTYPTDTVGSKPEFYDSFVTRVGKLCHLTV